MAPRLLSRAGGPGPGRPRSPTRACARRSRRLPAERLAGLGDGVAALRLRGPAGLRPSGNGSEPPGGRWGLPRPTPGRRGVDPRATAKGSGTDRPRPEPAAGPSAPADRSGPGARTFQPSRRHRDGAADPRGGAATVPVCCRLAEHAPRRRRGRQAFDRAVAFGRAASTGVVGPAVGPVARRPPVRPPHRAAVGPRRGRPPTAVATDDIDGTDGAADRTGRTRGRRPFGAAALRPDPCCPAVDAGSRQRRPAPARRRALARTQPVAPVGRGSIRLAARRPSDPPGRRAAVGSRHRPRPGPGARLRSGLRGRAADPARRLRWCGPPPDARPGPRPRGRDSSPRRRASRRAGAPDHPGRAGDPGRPARGIPAAGRTAAAIPGRPRPARPRPVAALREADAGRTRTTREKVTARWPGAREGRRHPARRAQQGRATDVLFNPTEYSVEYSANFQETSPPGLSSPIIQFVNGNAQVLTMDLLFDTYTDGGGADVTAMTRPFIDMLSIDATCTPRRGSSSAGARSPSAPWSRRSRRSSPCSAPTGPRCAPPYRHLQAVQDDRRTARRPPPQLGRQDQAPGLRGARQHLADRRERVRRAAVLAADRHRERHRRPPAHRAGPGPGAATDRPRTSEGGTADADRGA